MPCFFALFHLLLSVKFTTVQQTCIAILLEINKTKTKKKLFAYFFFFERLTYQLRAINSWMVCFFLFSICVRVSWMALILSFGVLGTSVLFFLR